MTDFIYRKNYPEQRAMGRKREKVRRTLRDKGILPPYNSTNITPEQQQILDQISRNDFSYWDTVKNPNLVRTHEQMKRKDFAPYPTKEEIIFYRAKMNARKRKLEFNLELSDIVVPQFCCYLGVELLYDRKDYRSQYYFSVDRIDSSKGYIKGNIQVISKLANTMKNNATHEQLVTFARNVLKEHDGLILIDVKDLMDDMDKIMIESYEKLKK